MFVELLELLRCPRSHEESPLIASSARTEARHIIEGTLGCPVCNAEFTITAGITYFDDAPPGTAEAPSAEIAMRLAAFLELTDTTSFAILCGRWGAHSDEISRLSQTPLVLVNPAESVRGDIAAIIRTRTVVPFRGDSARGVAFDERASPALTDSLVRVVRPGGRVVGPAALPVPSALEEIVRDDRVWVARKADGRPPDLVGIRRERRG